MNIQLFKNAFTIALIELSLRHDYFDLPEEHLLLKLRTLAGNKDKRYQLINLSARTGLTGLYLTALKRVLPEHEINQIKEKVANEFPRVQIRTFKDMFLNKELKVLIPAFADGDCKMVVMKGPLLAQEIYQSSESRNHVDLDMLVAPENTIEATAILNKCNYKQIESAETEDVTEFHHLVFEKVLKSGLSSVVELHFRLRTRRFGGIALEWSNVTTLMERVESPISHFRFQKDALFAHALLEAFEDGGSFRHLIDLLAISCNEKINHRSYSNEVIDKWGLMLAYNFFRHIYDDSKDEIFSNADNDCNENKASNGHFFLPSWLFDPEKSLSLRLVAGHYFCGGIKMAFNHFLYWGLFPPMAVMARRVGLARSSKLLPLCYLFAPFITVYCFLFSRK